ncbi:unnamed protein product [Thlaspi arvense]|uniref:Histidine-containing phosphotransfer protein n=1 Tax=Thlaspi arvense TaxID=13288 RepID=A0AAU9REC7_THLAR|nr:unnamed protein product [Thlaspi arvense]
MNTVVAQLQRQFQDYIVSLYQQNWLDEIDSALDDELKVACAYEVEGVFKMIGMFIWFFFKGFLDNQFSELRKLQDEGSPDFVAEVVSLFFDDCAKLINSMSTSLERPENVDFKQVDSGVHQLKGSSSRYIRMSWGSIIIVGARRVKNVCISFKECCDVQNREGCLRCLQQVDSEYKMLKTKLQVLFNLEQQILQAGGTIPQVDIN